jgi:excisionase family DNA binding protein
MVESNEKKSGLVFYTTAEIAEMLKMNVQVIARKLSNGEIPGFKIGKDWRVNEKDFKAWLDKHSNRRRLSDSEKVISRFVKDGKVAILPAQRKRKKYILELILKEFDVNRTYSEQEVNEIITSFYDDYCTIRRLFIEEKMMNRTQGKYRRNNSYIFIS